MSTIKISEATKVYGGKLTALHGIDLTVQDGEMLVLVGPSGCGKSTLLRMIAGLESITTGTIAIVIRKCVKERFSNIYIGHLIFVLSRDGSFEEMKI